MSATHAGKAAIVTGASRGIGLAVAERLVAEGARVVITARKPDALAAAVEKLGPDNAAFVAGGADDPACQEEVVATALERYGRIDYLVNNTGINPAYGSLLDLDPAASAKIFGVNVIAALEWVKKVHAAWMGANGGAVVNVASVAGLRAAPNIAMYGASKAALIHLTEELAHELGPAIRVNAVAPAVVKTRFATALFEGQEEQVVRNYPLKRLGAPEDIAGAVSFLLSGDAAWITGHTLTVDGGLTLGGGV
ncbi:SDR family oxidoreductase [Dactylosporangium sp. NPDC000244]|uniref:SDR family oxidoreductase n=1 Tax=Dactylosporangium sp. NPDC000244 TaxID=3154365 RepID=UPI00332DE5F5